MNGINFETDPMSASKDIFSSGKRMVGEDGEDGMNDMYHENKLLSKETQNLRTRIKAMQVRHFF